MEWITFFFFFSRDSYQGRKSNFYPSLPRNLKGALRHRGLSQGSRSTNISQWSGTLFLFFFHGTQNNTCFICMSILCITCQWELRRTSLLTCFVLCLRVYVMYICFICMRILCITCQWESTIYDLRPRSANSECF